MRPAPRFVLVLLVALLGSCAPPDGTPEIYFCPADGCADRVIERIDTAERSVVAAVFTFTHYGIAEAIARAHQERGVEAFVVVERSQLDAGLAAYLTSRGVGFKVDTNPELMHDKFVVIDERTVGTGSFNYTQQADTQNNENLVFFDSADGASLYFDEFMRLWATGEKLNP
jgi:phosphatidylserine/phosphatidylglycerophosphate/cardiolipin synthase-like enzyme